MFYVLMLFGVAAIIGWVAYISKRDEFDAYKDLAELTTGSLQDDLSEAKTAINEVRDRGKDYLEALGIANKRIKDVANEKKELLFDINAREDDARKLTAERDELEKRLTGYENYNQTVEHKYNNTVSLYKELKAKGPRLYAIKKKVARNKHQPYTFELKALNHKPLNPEGYHNESDLDKALALFGDIKIINKIKQTKELK